MLTRLSEILNRYAKGWIVLVFFALEIFFNAVILPAEGASMQAASGGTGPIDLQFFYPPEKAYSMIQSYGDAGRARYRVFELTGDIIYPIVYTLFFGLAITWLFRRGFAKESKMHRLNVVPFGGWLLDLLENLGIVAMLSIFPSPFAVLGWVVTVFTMVKWLFAGASIILLLVGVTAALASAVRRK